MYVNVMMDIMITDLIQNVRNAKTPVQNAQQLDTMTAKLVLLIIISQPVNKHVLHHVLQQEYGLIKRIKYVNLVLMIANSVQAPHFVQSVIQDSFS